MKRWVVTGPAGAGKSEFTRHLCARGARRIDGDALGHEILARPDIQEAIVAAFGPRMVQDGRVDRQLLAELVFQDGQALAWLNRITHPPLVELAKQRFAAAEGPLAVLEAAVYFLWPDPPAADLVIAVLASEAVRRQRLERGGLDAAAAAARLGAQRNLDRHWIQAGEVVVNDGTLADLQASADRLLARYLGPDWIADPEA